MKLCTESPIEEVLIESLAPLLHDGVKLETQKWIHCRGTDYRVDIWLHTPQAVVVIECDGREFHDFRKDRMRDVALLAVGGVDEVYHFRGCDIHHWPERCIDRMRSWAPFLFDAGTERSTLEHKALAASGLCGAPDKPIIRSKESADQLRSLDKSLRLSNGVYVLLEARKDCIVQFKSCYWHDGGEEATR